MNLGRLWAASSIVAFLAFLPSPTDASPGRIDESRVSWAYGLVVDSVTVSGNKGTKSHVILREMETQPGDVLDRETIRRDIRYLSDMTPFSSVSVRADALGPGRCAVRIAVRERSEILLKAILPQFKYDFERGLTYGIRWNNQNFRGRLENLSLSYSRNEQNDESVSLGWSAPWLGWRHISLGSGIAYYNRGDEPQEIELLERLGVVGYVGVPLTESRVHFSQLILSLGLDKSRTGGKEEDPLNGETGDRQVSLSPLIGFRYDSRDSPLRPTLGWTLNLSVRATFPFDDQRNRYYRLFNEVRRFVSFGEDATVGLLSNLEYQFGDFPSYSDLKLGGTGSLRGYPSGRFDGNHRWFQTVEWRHQVVPRVVVELPIIHEFDIGLAMVTFMDTGIVWNGSDDFELDRFHGTGGVGLQFFSPIQDVIRLEFGFSAHGDYRFHTATGARF
jgi:outer membrane protein insertion porin family